MNIFFDVDETILGYDGSLRLLVSDVFQRLTEDGQRVYDVIRAATPPDG